MRYREPSKRLRRLFPVPRRGLLMGPRSPKRRTVSRRGSPRHRHREDRLEMERSFPFCLTPYKRNLAQAYKQAPRMFHPVGNLTVLSRKSYAPYQRGNLYRTKRRRPLRDVPATDTRTAWKSRLSPLAREAQSLANNRFSELWWSTNNLRHGSGTYLTIRGERRMVSVFVPSDSPTQPNIANFYWVYRGRGRRESDTTKPSTRHIFEVVARP